MFDVVWLEETGRKLTGVNTAAGSDEDLCSAAVGLARLAASLAAAQSRVLAELDARGVCDAEFGLTTGSWLARETAQPLTVARRQVQVAAKLRDRLPEVADALAEGAVTVHHAQVLAEACNPRIADAVADLQSELLTLAAETSFEQWRAEVRGIVNLLDEDGAHDPNDDLARNRLSVSESLDGTTHLNGQLVGDTALGVAAAIDTKANELFHRFRADNDQCPDIDVPGLKTLRALALAELVRAGQAVDLNATKPPRPEVTLVVPADEPDATSSPNGTRLADGTTRTLRCDAHHLDQYRNGGRTDVARMASLCRRHHGVTHRSGWQMHATTDGWFWWTTPTGRTFWSQRHGRRRAGPPPIPAANPPGGTAQRPGDEHGERTF